MSNTENSLRQLNDLQNAPPRRLVIDKRRRSFALDAVVFVTVVGIAFVPSLSIYAAVALLASLAVLRPDYLHVSKYSIIAMALGLWALLSAVLNLYFVDGTYYVTHVTIPLILIFSAMLMYANSLRNLMFLIFSLYVAGLSAALYLILRATTPTESSFSSENPDVVLAAAINEVRIRPIIEGANINWYAYSSAMGLVAGSLFVWFLLIRSRKRLALAVGLSLTIILYGMVFTGTRGVLVSSVALLVALLLVRQAPGLTSRALAIGIGIWAVAFAFYSTTLMQSEAFNSLMSRTFPTSGLDGRDYIWPAAQSLVNERPWLGYGLTAYSLYLPAQAPPHNLALSVIFALGIPGLVLYIALITSMVWVGRAPTTDSLFLLAIPMIVVLFVLPIWTTGVWEWAPLNWILLAVAGGAASLRSKGTLVRAAPADCHSVLPTSLPAP